MTVAIGIQAGADVCGLLGASGNVLRLRLQAKATKHNQIRILAESKLNSVADRISAAQTDHKISDEEFLLILSEIDKYNQMKEDIRGRQKQDVGLSEGEKNELTRRRRE